MTSSLLHLRQEETETREEGREEKRREGLSPDNRAERERWCDGKTVLAVCGQRHGVLLSLLLHLSQPGVRDHQ